MRGRREHIVRGAKLTALAPELKTRQIKKFNRKCRARVNQLAALTSASGGIPSRLYDFNSDGGRYHIDYAGPGLPWTVEVVRAPPKKAKRERVKKKAGKEAGARRAAHKEAGTKKAAPKAAPKRGKTAPAVGAAHKRVAASANAAARPSDRRSGEHFVSPKPTIDPQDKP